METVSLIDKPKAKATDGTPKVRTTILPPISKLVAEAGVNGPAAGAGRTPTRSTCASCGSCRLLRQPTVRRPPKPHLRVEEEPKNVITIKPPIIVKELATQLGVEKFPADQGADG